MRLLVIDTETSGLFPSKYQMLTLGMVLIEVDSDGLGILEERHIPFGYEVYNISRSAMRVNGIDIEEHKRVAVPVEVAIGQVHDFLDEFDLRGVPILGHNVNFDERFIRSTFEGYGSVYPFHEERVDTLYIWRKLKRDGKIDQEYNSKLGTLAEYFGIDYSKAHDALEDCRITARVYFEILKILG